MRRTAGGAIDVGDGWATQTSPALRPTPYEVDISWSVTARGVSVADDCTCPLGGSCKHAVAVIVGWRRHTNASVGIAGGSRRTTSATGLAASRPGPTWRTAFDRLRSDDERAHTTLALQFTISRPGPPPHDRARRRSWSAHAPRRQGEVGQERGRLARSPPARVRELRSVDPDQLADPASGCRIPRAPYSSGSTAVPWSASVRAPGRAASRGRTGSP